MEIKILSYIPAIIGVLSIALFVFLNDSKNKRNRIFAVLNLSISLWLLSLFLADISTNTELALWLLRIALFFGAIVFLMFFVFALSFPFASKLRFRTRAIYYLPPIAVAVLSLTPLVIKSVSIKDYGVQPQEVGNFYVLSDLIGIVYLILGTLILINKYKKSNHQQKNQIRLVLWGLAVAATFNIATGLILTLLKIDTNLILLGNFSLFIFSLIVAYAIVRHGFFDIRLVVARALGYLLSLGTISAIFVFSTLIVINQILPENQQVSLGLNLLYASMALVLMILFHPVKKFFDRNTNKFFYRDAYDPQLFLDKHNQILVSNIELTELLGKSSSVIVENLKTTYCAFLVHSDARAKYRSIGAGNKIYFSDEELKNIKDYFEANELSVALTSDLEERSNVRRILRKHDVGLIAKLVTKEWSKDSNIGFLMLGIKKSGNPFHGQDVRMVSIITNELAIAVQNALRFEEISQFNITLQKKIDDATRDLQRSNTKLKALDEAKDDFISMASHQLRTPLTSVKGYLSMVLDGDAGAVKKEQKVLLQQAFDSSQRMVYLISDLLNVSRLRTGKFIIENGVVNLANLVQAEVEQLQKTAASRHLTLTYERPKDFPDAMLDETKIRQVVMNFMDNAIYYTPAGGSITVAVKATAKSIEYTVTDTGLGVPVTEQKHLFTKFFRAGNAKKMRPDGTGLGLYMAKKVIVAQGGALIFKSTPGKGSTFGFSFALDKVGIKK